MARKGPKPRPVAERFWPKVDKTAGEDQCWPWIGSLGVKGYGTFFPGGNRNAAKVPAHRISWFLTHGTHPGEFDVLHHCDNRRCVNPAHLYLGTDKENVRDREMRGRGKQPRGSDNGRSKLTDDQVSVIRERFDAGETQTLLAAEFGVSQPQISRIILRKQWH